MKGRNYIFIIILGLLSLITLEANAQSFKFLEKAPKVYGILWSPNPHIPQVGLRPGYYRNIQKQLEKNVIRNYQNKNQGYRISSTLINHPELYEKGLRAIRSTGHHFHAIRKPFEEYKNRSISQNSSLSSGNTINTYSISPNIATEEYSNTIRIGNKEQDANEEKEEWLEQEIEKINYQIEELLRPIDIDLQKFDIDIFDDPFDLNVAIILLLSDNYLKVCYYA